MTIVAGFSFDGGILMCADSLHTGYAHTVHEPKLFGTDYPEGLAFVFGFAGNSSFAKAAVLTCQHKLWQSARSDDDILEILERTVDEEYRRLVLSTPAYVNDPNVQYRLLIGVCRPNSYTKLFGY